MADLNARIIAKASAIAGEVPVGSDLDVAEISVNTADGKLYTKHTDGTIVDLSGGGGSSVSNLADLDDVENFTPSDGELLYSDNGEYKHKPISEILAGRATYTPGLTSTVTSDTGMAGLNGFYADNTAMVADGFTVFGGSDQDDAALDIPDAAFADYAQVDFFARGFSNLVKIKVNTNGSVYLNQTDVTITARTGDYATDHSSVSLAVSWLSQDTETRRSGYKEITQDGTDWFVVRVDMKVTYPNETGGYPLEAWFGKDGRIRQYFGSKIGSGPDISFSSTEQGVATLGTNLTNVSGLNAAGGQRVEYLFNGVEVLGFAGAKLEDLSDVGTPADDQFLVYDAASSSWVPESLPPAAPVDSVNGETGVVSLGIQEMDDFELIPANPWEYDFLWNTKLESGASNLPGEWGTNNVNWAATDSEGKIYSATGTQQFWLSPDNATWTEVNGNVIHYTLNSDYYYIENSDTTLTDQIDNEGWVNLYLTFTDPTNHSLTETPLEEGDILQWNNADQKFKPAQLPAGGGGAVDSVNGETGDVSLGIQEMDDFKLNRDIAAVSVVRGPQASAGTYVNSENGTWSWQNSTQQQLSYFDQDGTDQRSLLAAWSVGHVISWTQNGTEIGRGEIQDFTVDSGFERVYWSFANGEIPFPASTSDDITVTNLTLSEGEVEVDLAEGDILQWVDADQKFKPAQLPAGITPPVDSVNGETGVVSLGIQDMDDYKPQLEPSGQPIGVWEFNGGPTSLCSRPGDAVFDNSWVAVAFVDLYGDNHEDALAELVGSTTWMEFAGVRTQISLGWPAFMDESGCKLQWDRNGVAISNGDRLKIWAAGVTPADEDVALPPVQGDVLRWDEVDQKFKPAQLPAGITPPVDSVNGETGVVSLGIQNMDDFAYDREIGSYSGNTDKTVGPVDRTGEWDMGSSPGFSYLSWHNGQNGAMDTLVAGTAVTFSSAGLPDHSTTVLTNPTTNDVNSRYVQLQDEWPQEYIDAPSGTPLVVTALPLPSLPIQPPVDGSVLQWNEVDQKFRSAQLPAAPVDSVNGQTDTVSLGIEDMDDYEPRNTGSILRWTTYDFQANSNDFYWANNNAVFGKSTGGVDAWTEMQRLQVGDVVQVTTGADDPTWYPMTVQTVAESVDNDTGLIAFTSNYPGAGTSQPNAPVSFASTRFLTGNTLGSYLAPSSGDIMVWESSLLKYKPSSDYISLTSLKAEVAAATDFADFQARIAAL